MKGLVVKNETAWSTDSLRALIAACLKARGASGPRHVTFAYQREGSRRLGCADYPRGGSYMVRVGRRYVETTQGFRIRINLPRPEDAMAEVFYPASGAARLEMKPEALRQVLITIEHEVDHTLGLRHAEMVEDATRPCEWAEHLPILFAPAPPKIDTRARKIAAHEAAISRMETRIKRLETAIKSRRRKISALQAADRRAMAARKGQP